MFFIKTLSVERFRIKKVDPNLQEKSQKNVEVDETFFFL